MYQPILEVFSVKCTDAYASLLKEIKRDHKVSKITHATPENTLQQTALDVFNNLWKWSKITISDTPYKVAHEQLNLTIREAGDLIGNGFHYSLSSNTTPINHIWYEIPFSGDVNALYTSANLPKRNFRIELKQGKMIFHFFTQDTIEEAAALIKQQRDDIINLIKGNQTDVDAFWESKKEVFLTQVKYEVEKKYEEENKKNDLNKLLS